MRKLAAYFWHCLTPLFNEASVEVLRQILLQHDTLVLLRHAQELCHRGVVRRRGEPLVDAAVVRWRWELVRAVRRWGRQVTEVLGVQVVGVRDHRVYQAEVLVEPRVPVAATVAQVTRHVVLRVLLLMVLLLLLLRVVLLLVLVHAGSATAEVPRHIIAQMHVHHMMVLLLGLLLLLVRWTLVVLVGVAPRL